MRVHASGTYPLCSVFPKNARYGTILLKEEYIYLISSNKRSPPNKGSAPRPKYQTHNPFPPLSLKYWINKKTVSVYSHFIDNTV